MLFEQHLDPIGDNAVAVSDQDSLDGLLLRTGAVPATRQWCRWA
jgi:hypothetical protein